jgi:hypothetical protein
MFRSENLKGRDNLEAPSLDGRIILKLISNSVGGCGLDWFVCGWGPVASSSEHGSESSGFTEGKEVPD